LAEARQLRKEGFLSPPLENRGVRKINCPGALGGVELPIGARDC